MGPGSSCRQGLGTVLLCHCLQWRGHSPAWLVLAAAVGLSPPLARAADRWTHAGSRQAHSLHPPCRGNRNRAAVQAPEAPHLRLLGVARGLAASTL